MDFTEYIDLAAERLGGRVLAANDEFFAPKENLLKAAAPVWIADKYTDVGKWMDGWETRRRQHSRLRLVHREIGASRHRFTASWWIPRTSKEIFRNIASLKPARWTAIPASRNSRSDATQWSTLLPKSPLAGDTQNPFRDLAVEPGHAPALQNLSGRRRGAPARPRRSRSRLAGASRALAAKSISPPSSTAAGSSFRATCFSARATI